jgi:hypothetical protein
MLLSVELNANLLRGMTPEERDAHKKQQGVARAQGNRDLKKDISERPACDSGLIHIIGYKLFHEFKKSWSSLHPMHPNAHIGNNILEFASQNTAQFIEAYVAPQHLDFSEAVGGAEILEELEEHQKGFWQGFENGIQIDVDDENLRKFMKGWMASGDRQNPSVDHRTPYSAFDVASTRLDKGFWRCISQESVEEAAAEYVYLPRQESSGGDYCLPFLSVVTTGGHITSCHIDGCGSGQLLFELYEVKLVIWWELTAEMKKEYAGLYHRLKGDFLQIGLERWPGFKWTILKQGDYVVMKPGTIHAVLSPFNAVIGGIYVLHEDWIRDGSLESCMVWQFEQMAAIVGNPNQDQLDLTVMLDHIMATEIKLWELLQERTEDEGLAKAVDGLLAETHRQVKGIKSHKGYKANQKMHKKK